MSDTLAFIVLAGCSLESFAFCFIFHSGCAHRIKNYIFVSLLIPAFFCAFSAYRGISISSKMTLMMKGVVAVAYARCVFVFSGVVFVCAAAFNANTRARRLSVRIYSPNAKNSSRFVRKLTLRKCIPFYATIKKRYNKNK